MSNSHVVTFVLLDVAPVVIAARLTGLLFRRIGQPAVVGEIVAGIALGPTLLGAFPGHLDQVLFPPDVRPYLSFIAKLGLALFMFIVGLEVDLSLIRGRARAAGTIAAGSIVAPFALVLHPLHPQVAGVAVPMLAFVLFLGIAISRGSPTSSACTPSSGPFVFGAAMPRRDAGALTRDILERLEQVSLLLLLPVFFVVAGLQVDVGALGVDGIWQLALILVAAIGSKFLGAAAAARTQRMPRRQQVGVLDPTMFTLMVIMALVTTMMTGPLLRRVYPELVLQRELAAAERAELGVVDAYTVFALLPEPEPGAVDHRRFAALAAALTGREHPAKVVLCRLLPTRVELEFAGGLAELAALVAVAGADAVLVGAALVGAGDRDVGAALAVPDATVVTVSGPVGGAGAVGVLVDDTAGGRAGRPRIAAHLALRAGAGLTVTAAGERPGRRCRRGRGAGTARGGGRCRRRAGAGRRPDHGHTLTSTRFG
ncbi:cation:proton antiporter [Pseudonocardia sp. GCM10023141]|uniref:cation:proton antiporter n=1 Tax=Pseudonocardia sp. GCM10023141 TaxID=3252653 RepID=UPI00360609D8